ncbi:MAG: hypothetical protein ACM3SQ_11795 [Betaproteobacteria bacterium]
MAAPLRMLAPAILMGAMAAGISPVRATSPAGGNRARRDRSDKPTGRAGGPAASGLPRFPLSPGTKWVYHERQEVGPGVHLSEQDASRAHGNVVESTVISTVGGRDRIADADYVRIESTRAGRPWLTEWYRLTAGGLMLGKRLDLEGGQEVPMDPPQQVLNASLRPGEAWQWRAADGSWSVRRRVIRRGVITVPAGSYSGTELDMALTVNQGPMHVTGHETSWFVPDVGFVKRDTETSVNGRFLTHVTQTLEKFEPAKPSAP